MNNRNVILSGVTSMIVMPFFSVILRTSSILTSYSGQVTDPPDCAALVEQVRRDLILANDMKVASVLF